MCRYCSTKCVNITTRTVTLFIAHHTCMYARMICIVVYIHVVLIALFVHPCMCDHCSFLHVQYLKMIVAQLVTMNVCLLYLM